MNPLALVKSPLAWAAAAGIAVLIAVAVIYHKGESAGASAVTSAVEHTTNKAIEDARKDKDKADAKVRTDPPDAVIDSTR